MTATTMIAPEPEQALTRIQSVNRRILLGAWRMPSFRIGFFIFVALLLVSAIYPEVSSISATKMIVKDKFLPPLFLGDKWAWEHPLGTDQLGRDMLMRSLIGLRYSLLVGIVTVVLIFIIGCGLGLFAGFKGKWWDTIIMRITDAQLSIPMIILAITILGVSRPSVESIIVVLALSGWPLYARVARSAAVAERGKEYVRGLRVLGAGDWRILLLFAAPNILPPIAFVAVLDVARMMIFEAILGFLGLGIQPPTPSFGSMIADSRKYLINAWWIALCLLVLSAGLYIGTAGRPALDDEDVDAAHAMVSQEMLVRHDFVVMYMDGVRYLIRPPMHFWLVAASYKLLGQTEFATRLPVGLAMVGIVLLTFEFGRRFFGQRAGLYGALAVATSVGMFLYTRNMIPEALYTFAFEATFYLFLRSWTGSLDTRIGYWGAAALCAFAAASST